MPVYIPLDKLVDPLSKLESQFVVPPMEIIEADILLSEDGTILSESGLPPSKPTLSTWLSDLDAPGGTVNLQSKFYVERKNENAWLQYPLRWGVTIRVKGAHQMGKSSLLARMNQVCRENGRSSFYLDMQRLDKDAFFTLDSLLRSIAELMSHRLSTIQQPHVYWSSPLGSKDKLSDFMLVEIVERSNSPVVLILDNVDIVFNYHYRDEFFSLIRAWHNDRAVEESWRKLNIVLSYSTEAYLFISDLNQSPFNVGVSIELTDFSRAEVEDLNVRHNSLITEPQELEDLLLLLGGHPYLWQVAFYIMATEEVKVPQLLASAYNEDGPFAEHLRRVLRQFMAQPILRNAMQEILTHNKCTDNESFYRLRASGIVLGHSQESVIPRCNLYARYFRTRL